MTPIAYACGMGNAGLVNVLLRRQCDLTVVNEDGSTPLHLVSRSTKEIYLLMDQAARGGHVIIIDRLIRAGAPLDILNKVR